MKRCFVIEIPEEKHLRCKLCNKKCTGGVNRLKHHLVETHHGMRPCNKVTKDIELECKEALANFKEQKKKRNKLLQDIGMGPNSIDESGLSKTMGTLGSEGGEPRAREPMDKFTTSQSR